MERFSSGNEVRLHRAGESLFAEMLSAIEGAREYVQLEMYWLAADRLGERFLAALAASAARGVRVYVLYDSFGSVATPDRHFEALRRVGALVISFNPISPLKERFRLARLTRRNHRKLLLTESRGYVGGANLSLEWLEPEFGGSGFHDDVVCVQGPCIAALHSAFARSWGEAGGSPIPEPRSWPTQSGSTEVAVLAQSQIRQRRQTIDAYLRRLGEAKQSIFLSNAYFVPNRRIIRALTDAKARGVDVRIMLPARSDVEIVRVASRAVWARLLKAGVRLFLWQPSVLHSKSGVIDCEWSTVGSFNLDYISVRNNSELNVSVLSRSFANVMQDAFVKDLLSCQEVEPQAFYRRPFVARLGERVLYWFREWL